MGDRSIESYAILSQLFGPWVNPIELRMRHGIDIVVEHVRPVVMIDLGLRGFLCGFRRATESAGSSPRTIALNDYILGDSHVNLIEICRDRSR